MKSFLFCLTVFSGIIGGIISVNQQVFIAGAMRDVMKKGDLSAKIALSELEDKPHLYALGAVEGLKGEVLILDSKVNVSFVESGALKTDHSFKRKAALLVYAQVPEWQSVAVSEDIVSKEAFEKFIVRAAERHGIDVSEPFPFLLEGEIASAQWHVIDWDKKDTVHTHQKHKESGLRGTLKNQDVSILGFYSDDHHGVFTHHTTNMHMHIQSKNEPQIAGHLDDFQLAGKMKLKLPAIE
jgi:acetolactate decarboxylase